MNFKHLMPLFVITVLLFKCSSGGDDPSSPDPNPTTVLPIMAILKAS